MLIQKVNPAGKNLIHLRSRPHVSYGLIIFMFSCPESTYLTQVSIFINACPDSLKGRIFEFLTPRLKGEFKILP